MTYRINVLFEKDEHGYFAYCPQLKGCHSQGETFEEASENIREAVELYLETMTAEEIRQVLPGELISTTIEVAVA
jgi:predicted RNase H-like HicB family nuclease